MSHCAGHDLCRYGSCPQCDHAREYAHALGEKDRIRAEARREGYAQALLDVREALVCMCCAPDEEEGLHEEDCPVAVIDRIEKGET